MNPAPSSAQEQPALPAETAGPASKTIGSSTRPASKPGPLPPAYVVLTGNPNSGKTTLFNALTGLRAKVGNYAGVTVERKEGRLLGAPAASNARVLDLPGTYSLCPQSLDEQISRDVLLNRLPEPAPYTAHPPAQPEPPPATSPTTPPGQARPPAPRPPGTASRRSPTGPIGRA